MPAFAQLRYSGPSAPIELEEAVVVGPAAAAVAPESVNWNVVKCQSLGTWHTRTILTGSRQRTCPSQSSASLCFVWQTRCYAGLHSLSSHCNKKCLSNWVDSICFLFPVLALKAPEVNKKRPFQFSASRSKFCIRVLLTSRAPDGQYNGRRFKDFEKDVGNQGHPTSTGPPL